MNLKELGVKQVSVRVDEGKYTQLLLRVGADNVVVPEEDFGKSYARSCISDTIMDYYEIDEEHAIEQISIPASFKDNGISLEQISFRKKYAINIVGIIRNDKFFIPFGKDSIQEDDILLVVGSHDKIKEFDSKINKK
jgi:trk system potassium uptake protein TrkA